MLGAFALTTQLTNRPLAGLFAAMIVAFWTVMPAYYVTWARYTHIAGLVSLCGVVSVIIPAVRAASPRRVVIAGISAAGLLMVHPRAVVLAVALLLPVILYMVAERLSDWRNRALVIGMKIDGSDDLRRDFVAQPFKFANGSSSPLMGEDLGEGEISRRPMIFILLCGLRMAMVILGTTGLAVALAMPWLIRLISEHGGVTFVSGAMKTEEFPLGLVWTDQDQPVYALAAVAVLFAVKSAPALAVALAGWLALSYLSANPSLLRLPFHLWTHNGAIAISAFLPAAIAGGWGLSRVAKIGGRFWRFSGWALVVAAGVASLMRAPAQLELINPVTILARPGDLHALRWAAENTDPQDLFLISGYRWQNDVYMGSDAGYWLPITSNRATTLPPLIYDLKARPERERIRDLAIQIEQAGNSADELYQLALNAGAKYVFVASRPGPISANVLRESDRFEMVYDSARAKIFLVKG